MAYDTGARVRLTREVQVTAHGTAAGGGFPGALFLAEGLAGIVTGVEQGSGGVAQDRLASFDEQVRHLPGLTAGLFEDLRQQAIRAGVFGSGAGTRTSYKVQFANGFVLDGLEEDWLAPL
ncbi:hypothetical protein GCM10009639_14570 [Kitasatospora putterlickiae]|uniref:Uncharacterized protein n=1 Tax=Kitasatospora putterlickiae TaxID=221725 RepID=A0ABN1XTZ6_9ACTN